MDLYFIQKRLTRGGEEDTKLQYVDTIYLYNNTNNSTDVIPYNNCKTFKGAFYDIISNYKLDGVKGKTKIKIPPGVTNYGVLTIELDECTYNSDNNTQFELTKNSDNFIRAIKQQDSVNSGFSIVYKGELMRIIRNRGVEIELYKYK